MKVKSFLSTMDHDRIVAAIRAAEARCRGEIRVHVAKGGAEDAQEASARQFEKLGMTTTAERNGILVFIAPKSQRFAVIGDLGIHGKCGEAFWTEIAAGMGKAFHEGRFTDGIVEAVARAGDALALHFPREAGGADRDELPNEVSEE